MKRIQTSVNTIQRITDNPARMLRTTIAKVVSRSLDSFGIVVVGGEGAVELVVVGDVVDPVDPEVLELEREPVVEDAEDPVAVEDVAVPVDVRVALVVVAVAGVGVGGKKPHCVVHASKLREMFRVTLLRMTRLHVRDVAVMIDCTVLFPAHSSCVKNVN